MNAGALEQKVHFFGKIIFGIIRNKTKEICKEIISEYSFAKNFFYIFSCHFLSRSFNKYKVLLSLETKEFPIPMNEKILVSGVLVRVSAIYSYSLGLGLKTSRAIVVCLTQRNQSLYKFALKLYYSCNFTIFFRLSLS